MKGIISIHYFTLYNIPIINELQLWSPTRSITAAPAGWINHRQKQVCGSSTRDKLIIRFTMMNCQGSTDRTHPEEAQWASTKMFDIHARIEIRTRRDVQRFRRMGMSIYGIFIFFRIYSTVRIHFMKFARCNMLLVQGNALIIELGWSLNSCGSDTERNISGDWINCSID